MKIFKSDETKLIFPDGREHSIRTAIAPKNFHPAQEFDFWADPINLEADGSAWSGMTGSGETKMLSYRHFSKGFLSDSRSFAQPFTAVFCARLEPGVTNQVLVNLHSNNGVYIAYNAANNKLLINAGKNFEVPLSVGQDFVWAIVLFAGNQSRCWVNGTVYSGDAGNNAADRVGVGHGSWGKPDSWVGEFGVGSGNLSQHLENLALFYGGKHG